MTKQRPTRDALLVELQKVAAEQGPDITVFQFRQLTGITPYYINTRWGNWTNLRRAAGLPVRAHAGLVYSDHELLTEYHRVAIEVDEYPTHADFNRLSPRCFYTLETRFGDTEAIHHQYRAWLAEHCPGDAPKFLEGCSPGCEPSVVPGLEIIDGSRLRQDLIGFGAWLLILLTNFVTAGVMVWAWPVVTQRYATAASPPVTTPPSAGERRPEMRRQDEMPASTPQGLCLTAQGCPPRGLPWVSDRSAANLPRRGCVPAIARRNPFRVHATRTEHSQDRPLREQPWAARRNSFGVKTTELHSDQRHDSGIPIMPLLPPAQLFDHPADLVIDVFGTFLGKRSERMVVRWREPAGTASRLLPGSRDALLTPTEVGKHPGCEEAAGVRTPHAHAADVAAAELLQLWATEAAGHMPEPRPEPAARLAQQLDRLTDVPTSHGDRPEWQERAVPMSRLRSVTVSGRGVTVSSDLIAALIERGIALSFLSGRGQPVASLSAPGLGGTVQTRRSQLAAYHAPLGVQLAVEFIRGKLRNQKHLLQYSGKYLKATEPARYDRLAKKIAAIAQMRKQLTDFEADDLDRVRDKLMGYEGAAARVYWEGVAIILEGRVAFPGRETRGATDPVNSAMNYGYGILYSQVSAAIVNAGLEMYAGFLHVDRPGKPALVLDLVEEFRAPIVDRAVLAIVNQGIAIETDDHGLKPATRKLIASRVLERLSTAVPYEGKRWELGTIIQNQARHLAVAVRGERIYRAFASRW